MSVASLEPIVVPPGKVGVYLIFAPTRSRITGFVIKGIDESLEPSRGHGDLWVKYSWGHLPATAHPTRLELEVEYEGEEVRRIATHWLEPQDADSDGLVPTRDDAIRFTRETWRIIYADRRRKTRNPCSAAERERRFMFEFDRQTHPFFVEFVEDMPDEERQFRRRSSPCLARQMFLQLKTRFIANRAQDAQINPIWVAYYSAIFWRASDLLFEEGETRTEPARLARTAQALGSFAAGAFRHRIDDTRIDGRYRAADIDSINVYLFAELGFAAVGFDVNRERWIQLLNTLVKMQRYYNERIEIDTSKRIEGYGPPEKALDTERRKRIDEYYEELEPAKLAAAVTKNLNQLSNAGFGVIRAAHCTDPATPA